MCNSCCSDPGCHITEFAQIIGPNMIDLDWVILEAGLLLIPAMKSEEFSVRERWRRLQVGLRYKTWKKQRDRIALLGYPCEEQPARRLANTIWKVLGEPIIVPS